MGDPPPKCRFVTAICLYIVRQIKIINRYCALHDGRINYLIPTLVGSWPYSTFLCGTNFSSHQNSTVFPTSEIQIKQFLQFSSFIWWSDHLLAGRATLHRLYDNQAPEGSQIFNPRIFGMGFCKIPGFFGTGLVWNFIPGFYQKSTGSLGISLSPHKFGQFHTFWRTYLFVKYIRQTKVSSIPSCGKQQERAGVQCCWRQEWHGLEKFVICDLCREEKLTPDLHMMDMAWTRLANWKIYVGT